MEVEATDSGWLPHIHSILFSKSEIKQEDLTESWSSVNPDPNAVHIIPANPADLRVMILYGCKHQKFTSTAQIASFFGATAGFRMAGSSGAMLRSVSAEANRERKANRQRQVKDSEYQNGRRKIISNINPRSQEFYELLWMTSPDFARFAYIV